MYFNNAKEFPLISVIIPVYNVYQYLDKCLESVVNQTYTNLEIIVVNDGSTDKSEDVINNYLERDNRIIKLNKVNGGLSDARNYALDRMHGEYVTFVDSDDFLMEDCIYKLYNSLIMNKADISCCEVTTYNQADEVNLVMSKDETLVHYLKDNSIFDESVWGKLYKSYIFKDLRFNKGKIHEDTFFTYKAIEKCNKTSYVNYPGYHNTQRKGSITHSVYSNKNYDKLEGCKEIFNFYKGTIHEENAFNKYLGTVLYFIIKTNGKNVEKNREAYKDLKILLKQKGNNKYKKQLIPFVMLFKIGLLGIVKI